MYIRQLIKYLKKNENKQKEVGIGPFKKISWYLMGNLPGTARVIEVIGVSNGDKDNEGKDDGDLHFGVLGLKMVGHKNEEN